MKIRKQFLANSQFLGNFLYISSNIGTFYLNTVFGQNIRFLECGHPIHDSINLSVKYSKKLGFTKIWKPETYIQ